MIKFKENAHTDGRTEGWKDRRTDRPYFIGPFCLPPGVQQTFLKDESATLNH